MYGPSYLWSWETILLQTGFIRNLDTNWRSPRLAPKSLRPSPSFKIQNWNFESVDRTQALLSFEDSELKAALLRSHHWLRRSHLESSIQLKALFLWFAIETLATLRKGENIVLNNAVSWFSQGKDWSTIRC